MIKLKIQEVCELLDGLKLFLVLTDIDFDRANIGKKVKGGYLSEDIDIDSLVDDLMNEYLMLNDINKAEYIVEII